MKIKNKVTKLATVLIGCALITACGGGGSASSPDGLSVVQKNYLASTLTNTYHGFYWNLPTTNIAPTSGTHYFLASTFSLAASPENAPQNLVAAAENMSTSLAEPNINITTQRVLKDGAITSYQLDSITKIYFSNGNVLGDQYASDGVTKIGTAEFDDWSEPIPLSGTLANSDILKRFYGFARLNNSSYFDKTTEWRAGSAYITRKRRNLTEGVRLIDWNTRTYDTNVDPWSGSQTTIETMFDYVETNFGGITASGTSYQFSDGAITTKEGTRMWIATEKLPTSTSASDAYAAFMELNNSIYLGHYIPALTRERLIDGLDSTIVNDFSIRFNPVALQTIKDAVNF